MFRFVVAIDVDAKTLSAAYAKLYKIMAMTPVSNDWESTDEAYDEGDQIHPNLIQKAREEAFVTCKICSKTVTAFSAHLHQDEWIGDECCWDDRLKASE